MLLFAALPFPFLFVGMSVCCIHVQDFGNGMVFVFTIARESGTQTKERGADDNGVSVLWFGSLLLITLSVWMSSLSANVFKRFVVEPTRSSPGRFSLVSTFSYAFIALNQNIEPHDCLSAASAFSVCQRFLGSQFLPNRATTAAVPCTFLGVRWPCCWPGVNQFHLNLAFGKITHIT